MCLSILRQFQCVLLSYVFFYSSATALPSNETFDEKYFQANIINGVPLNIRSMPSAAAIFIFDSLCAGSILNSWAVLSAAHCFEQNNDPNDIYVNVGGTFVHDPEAKMYDVEQLVMHPRYSVDVLFDCDIALLFVDGPIRFGGTVQKAVLISDLNWMNKKNKNFVVSGWGLTEEKGQISKQLQKAVLAFVKSPQCAAYHRVQITQNMFCLYGDAIQDTCRGDSGGGVMWHNFLVGIVSHGNGCARKNRPSVYTNVFIFRDWIKKTVYDFMVNRCKNLG